MYSGVMMSGAAIRAFPRRGPWRANCRSMSRSTAPTTKTLRAVWERGLKVPAAMAPNSVRDRALSPASSLRVSA